MRAFLFVLWWACLAVAGCPEHFAGGIEPAAQNVTELCYTEFAVGHSPMTLTPLWSAEHLTADRISKASKLKRKDTFHPDQNLPKAARAELRDYLKSGYDRGHMSPNLDMSTPKSQGECFTLANMVPQAKKVNEDIWEQIESGVRSEVLTGDDLYVVTGPIFDKDEKLNDRVSIPTRVFKAVYSPSQQAAGAYVAPNAKNDDGTTYATMSIADLEAQLGFQVFDLPPDIKQVLAVLPKPHR